MAVEAAEFTHFVVREQKNLINLFATEAKTSPFLAACFTVVYSSLQQYFYCDIIFFYAPAQCNMYITLCTLQAL